MTLLWRQVHGGMDTDTTTLQATPLAHSRAKSNSVSKANRYLLLKQKEDTILATVQYLLKTVGKPTVTAKDLAAQFVASAGGPHHHHHHQTHTHTHTHIHTGLPSAAASSSAAVAQGALA